MPDQARRAICAAMVFGCLLFGGCERPEVQPIATRSPGPTATNTPDREPQPHFEGTGGFVCGPWGGAWVRETPPPHFVDWSPDGTNLTFDDATSVRMVDAEGTRLRQVVDATPGYYFGIEHWLHADLSPDGRQVAYTSCEYRTEPPAEERRSRRSPRSEYLFEIATVAVDGSTATRLTTDSEYDHMPSWSPNGRRIAYLSEVVTWVDWKRTYRNLRILSMQGDGGASDLLVSNEFLADVAPQWSPDGSRLAVLTSADTDFIREKVLVRISSLTIVEADGSGQHTVAGDVMSGVSWSPDGQRLAFARRHGQGAQLVTVAANGSDERVIRLIGDLRDLRGLIASVQRPPWSVYRLSHVLWSPDGAHILYGCGYQLCVVNLDGEIVGRTPEEYAYELGRAAAAWAPDGSRVAVRAAGNPTPNGAVALYTMAPDGSDVRVLVRGGLAMVAEHSGYQDAAAGKAACREGDVVPNPASNPGLVADCETLMAMRDTLAGPTILNWGAGTPLAQWAGVQVSGEPPRVTGLKFRSRQGVHSHESLRLIGRIPPETSDLDQLQTLDLSGHTFFDDVPRDLERLAHLRELDLRLHGGAWMSGCLSAAFIEQLEVAEGVRVCAQASGA